MQSAMLSPARSDAGTVAMATGMPVSSIMSMLTSPLQSNILSTMAKVVRNDMTSPTTNKVANPARMTLSMMSQTIMNPMVSSMANPSMSTMTNPMSTNPMSTNSMISSITNPMDNPLMLLMNSRMLGRTNLLTNRNSAMVDSMMPASNPDTAILVPSADEILSSAMMEAIGQTDMPAYQHGSQLSRFFGSSYF